jgi:hypothetical protein
LIAASILIGYLVERVFGFILAYVKVWAVLVGILLMLYLMCGSGIWLLKRDALDLYERDPSAETTEARINTALKLWKIQASHKFTFNESLAYNHQISFMGKICRDRRTLLPSSFKMHSFWTACLERVGGLQV